MEGMRNEAMSPSYLPSVRIVAATYCKNPQKGFGTDAQRQLIQANEIEGIRDLVRESGQNTVI